MNKTLFIADLHLSASRPDITQCFIDFLQSLDPHHIDALYILGDLFEVWIGDDDISDFTTAIAEAIRRTAEKGINIAFIHGNRDFLVRQKFAQRAGMTLLPEQQVIQLYGEHAVILHGDELCTRDVNYQKFRKKARSWWWPRFVLMLPLKTRRKIADNGRKKSKESQSQLTQDIMDVTDSEVEKCMQKHAVQLMIHGHTHRPAIHQLKVNHQAAQRIVLGDWYEQGSVLEVTLESKNLKQLPFLRS